MINVNGETVAAQVRLMENLVVDGPPSHVAV